MRNPPDTHAAERFTLGIVGPPGAGKSTLAALVCRRLGSIAVALPMDGFHMSAEELYRRGLTDRKGSPQSFERDKFSERLRAVRAGTVTTWPAYDRSIHDVVDDAIAIPDAKVIVVEGNYLLLWPEVREQLDESWFVDVPRDVRLERLSARHIAGGRTVASTREWMAANDVPNAEIVESTRELADRVIDLVDMPDPLAGSEVLARFGGDGAG